MHDSSLGTVLAKPQGLPLCLQPYGLGPTAPHPHPINASQNKYHAAHFNCLYARRECLIRCQVLLKTPLCVTKQQAKDDYPEGDDFTPQEYLFLVFHSSSNVQTVLYRLHKAFFSPTTFNTSEEGSR